MKLLSKQTLINNRTAKTPRLTKYINEMYVQCSDRSCLRDFIEINIIVYLVLRKQAIKFQYENSIYTTHWAFKIENTPRSNKRNDKLNANNSDQKEHCINYYNNINSDIRQLKMTRIRTVPNFHSYHTPLRFLFIETTRYTIRSSMHVLLLLLMTVIFGSLPVRGGPDIKNSFGVRYWGKCTRPRHAACTRR